MTKKKAATQERFKGKILMSKIAGEVRFNLGDAMHPLERKVLYVRLCFDDGSWALVFQPDSDQDSIEFTTLPNDGGVMVKVLRR